MSYRGLQPPLKLDSCEKSQRAWIPTGVRVVPVSPTVDASTGRDADDRYIAGRREAARWGRFPVFGVIEAVRLSGEPAEARQPPRRPTHPRHLHPAGAPCSLLRRLGDGGALRAVLRGRQARALSPHRSCQSLLQPRLCQDRLQACLPVVPLLPQANVISIGTAELIRFSQTLRLERRGCCRGYMSCRLATSTGSGHGLKIPQLPGTAASPPPAEEAGRHSHCSQVPQAAAVGR
jgi:hypothetical protein